MSAAASASATILSGSLMARLTPEATTGLPANRCLVLHADVGGEDDGVGGGDRVGGQRRAARRALGLDVQRDAGLLGGGDQRVGRHVGVRDAGRAGGDRDERLGLLGFGASAGFAAARRASRCGGRRGRVDHAVDQADHLVGRRRVAQRLHEILAHQGTGEARQQLHVLGAAGFRGGDQEGEVGGTVGCAEVDRRASAGRNRSRRCRRTASGSAEWRCRRVVRWPTGLRGPSRRATSPSASVVRPASARRSDEPADHRLLVGAGVDVEQHQVGGDDRLRGGGAGHGATFGLVVTGWLE